MLKTIDCLNDYMNDYMRKFTKVAPFFVHHRVRADLPAGTRSGRPDLMAR